MNLKPKDIQADKKAAREEKKDVVFCTECGADLDQFFLSENINDEKALKENFERCKNIGKFKGELCSKLFIALDLDPEQLQGEL